MNGVPPQVNIPHPRNKDLERMTDEELDAYLAEHDVVQQELGSLDDRELDVLLEASALRGSAGAPPVPVSTVGVPPGAVPEMVAPSVNPPETPMTTGEATAGGMREFAGGMSAEFSDEAEAAARAPFSGRSYDELLREVRASRERFARQEPLIATGLNVAGGIGSMFVPGAAALGRGAQALSGIGRLASPLARTAATGALAGGVSGFGAGEGGFGERLTSAGMGAALGAGLGTSVQGLGALGRYAGETRRALRETGDADAEARAAEVLYDRLAASGISPRDLGARLDTERAAGVPTMLATSTPEFGRVSENVLREVSENRPVLAERLTEQQINAPSRARAAVETAVPTPDYFATVDQVQDTLRRNANTAYDAAYAAAPEVRDPRLRQVLSNPRIQSAYQDALKTSEDEMAAAVLRGEDPSKFAMKKFMDPVINEQGELSGLTLSNTTVPDLRSLDTVKKALDARISALYASGQGGTATSLKELRNAFVNRLDQVGPPEYRAARAQFKGDIEIKQALEEGLKSNTLRWQQVAKLARDYSPGELQAFKTGFMQNIARGFEDTSRSRNFARELVANAQKRKSLQALTSPEEFRVLETVLRREAELFDQTSRVIGGSQTFGRQTEKQALDEALARGDQSTVLDIMMNPTPGNLFRRTMGVLSNMRNANVSRGAYNQLARMLSAQDPAEVNAVLASLAEAAPVRQQANEALGKRTRQAATAGAFTLAPSPEREMPPEVPFELQIPSIDEQEDDTGLAAMPMGMQ